MEEVPAFAEDAAQHFWEGEDKLAVGSFVADGSGDPCAGLADPALMTGGAEVAGFAGECEELFVAAIRALEAGEPCGEVTTAEKCADGVDGILAERPHGGVVVRFVGGKEGVPCVVDDLPERRCARPAWMMDRGRHGIRGRGAMSAPGSWGGVVGITQGSLILGWFHDAIGQWRTGRERSVGGAYTLFRQDSGPLRYFHASPSLCTHRRTHSVFGSPPHLPDLPDHLLRPAGGSSPRKRKRIARPKRPCEPVN